jgi:hypothetical protein
MPNATNLSGFNYDLDLLYAAVANTYIETVGSRADSLHLAIKRVTASDIYLEYLKTVEILGNRFQLSEKDVLLAFDYTEENLYGDVQGFWIYLKRYLWFQYPYMLVIVWQGKYAGAIRW